MPVTKLDSTSLSVKHPVASDLAGKVGDLKSVIELSYEGNLKESRQVGDTEVTYEFGTDMGLGFRRVDTSKETSKESGDDPFEIGFPLYPESSQTVVGLEVDVGLSGSFSSSKAPEGVAFSIKVDAGVAAVAGFYRICKKTDSLASVFKSTIQDYVFPFDLPDANSNKLKVANEALKFEYNAELGVKTSVTFGEVLLLDRSLIKSILPDGGDYGVSASLSAEFAVNLMWESGLTVYVTRSANSKLRFQVSSASGRGLGGEFGFNIGGGVKEKDKVEKAIKGLFEDLYEIPRDQWEYLVLKLKSGVEYDDLSGVLKKPVDKLLEKFKVEYDELSEKLTEKITKFRDRFIELATLQFKIEVGLAWENNTRHGYLLDVIVDDGSAIRNQLYLNILLGRLPSAFRAAKADSYCKIVRYLEIFEESIGDSANISVSLGKLFTSKRSERRQVNQIHSIEYGKGERMQLLGEFSLGSDSTLVNYNLKHSLVADTSTLEDPKVKDIKFSAQFDYRYSFGAKEFAKESGKGKYVLDDQVVRFARWILAYDSGFLQEIELRAKVARQLKLKEASEVEVVIELAVPDNAVRNIFQLESSTTDEDAAAKFVSEIQSIHYDLTRKPSKELRDLGKDYRFVRKALRNVGSPPKLALECLRGFWFESCRLSKSGTSTAITLLAYYAYHCRGLPKRCELSGSASNAADAWFLGMSFLPDGENAPLFI